MGWSIEFICTYQLGLESPGQPDLDLEVEVLRSHLHLQTEVIRTHLHLQV